MRALDRQSGQIGATFPPVTVFDTGDALLLADGFHRWHVHKALQIEVIETEIRKGSWRDALLFSLQANAKHGLPRSKQDLIRGYDLAVEHGLVDATDAEAVAVLLGCSGRSAEMLTEKARTAARRARDAKIVSLKAAGKTVREIAGELGISKSAVDRVVPKTQTAETGQDGTGQDFKPGNITAAPPPPDTPPRPRPAGMVALDEMLAPNGQAWHATLEALREINKLWPVETLFAQRYRRIDHAIGPELDRAYAWITAMHQRFHHDDVERRRA